MVAVHADGGDVLQSGAVDVEIEDPHDDDDSVAPVRYQITSFGVDFDVEGLCGRLGRGEIVVPEFQRNYVWDIKRASRFVESLLLGLPVPGIFLSRDFDSSQYVVIDGQQRLKTLRFFRDGMFDPTPESNTSKVFKLTGVQERFKGRTYQELDPNDQFRLDNSLIHATVVKQDVPSNDDTSMYHIFDRINTGGLRLSSQEIRGALYHGRFIDHLGDLNRIPSWRSIFGGVHRRRSDQELILRFLAFFFDEDRYRRPMSEFLTQFVGSHRNPPDDFLLRSEGVFTQTMDAFSSALGNRAFRPDRALNAAVFDSMSVGLARRIESSGRVPRPKQTIDAHRDLLEDQEYMEAVSSWTSDERFVKARMKKAIDRFSDL